MTSNATRSPIPILVLGGDSTGVAVVERVLRDHDTVLFLDPDPDAVEAASVLGATADTVDITSGQTLEAALPDVEAIELAIVAAEPDAKALLVGQLAKTKLDASTVIVPTNDPRNWGAFESAGMIPVCATTALADAVAATSSLVHLCDSDQPPEPTAPTNTIDSSRPERPV